MPKGATPDFSAKTVGGNSLSCPEATDDYTLAAIRRSTETLHGARDIAKLRTRLKSRRWNQTIALHAFSPSAYHRSAA